MGKLKVNKIIEEDVYYAPCIECGCDELIFNNCGYTTFNVGSVKCKNCENKVEIKYLDTNATDADMVSFWNEKNDVNILISELEEHIDECNEKLKFYKSKLPKKIDFNLEAEFIYKSKKLLCIFIKQQI